MTLARAAEFNRIAKLFSVLMAVCAATTAACCIAAPLAAQTATAAALSAPPSRAPVKGCKWEKNVSQTAGLAAWTQRCDFGTRKIDLFFKGKSLVQRFSDGGEPDALVDVIDMLPSEVPVATVQRAYARHTPSAIRKLCTLAPYTEGGKPVAGTVRYTFVPNAVYAKELAKNKSTDIPEPPCGDWGTAPDGIQYFQVWPSGKVRKVLFVRVGQDEPLFDERTLELLPPGSQKP